MGGKRDTELKQCVYVGCQFVVQNSNTDRQVKHKPKVDTGFIRRIETPPSVGLPLTIHQRVRDKNLLRVLSSVYLGTRYENILNITKRIEHAMVLRMKNTGGYCLPDFIKKGITVDFSLLSITLTFWRTPHIGSVLYMVVLLW